MGGKPHGDGVKTVADNTIIEGTFRDGLAFDQGKMTRENASGVIEFVYEGEFFADKPEGHGLENRADGKKYEGYFTKGKKGPSGTMWFGDGNIY
jgi:hypothetical protein